MDTANREISTQRSKTLDSCESTVTPQDLCYVIYTSGTTGRPKGVQIEHASVVHFVRCEQELFQIQPEDRVFQGFSVAFDASVEEMWLAFASGASLVVGTADVVRSGPDLAGFLTQAGITVLSCVPTLLSMTEEDISSLRLLILGGEVCPAELVKRWWRPNRRVINTYGPTEATVVATYAECHPDQPVTIGKPLPGYIALVLDENLQPVAAGEEGELVLGGPALARGYLANPQLTAEKFILRSFYDGPVQRFYRTGDRVRLTAGQELEFLGRVDSQIKIRGFRVELSEIESVILQQFEVKAAAVVCQATSNLVQGLTAFVVPKSGEALDLGQLRKHLTSQLPGYMIPGSIEILSELPTLPSGKVDRTALALLPSPSVQVIPETSKECSYFEREILRAWGKWLGASRIEKTADFFSDLGAHSLVAARVVSELRGSPEFEGLSMADVYRYSTTMRLAVELENRNKSKTGRSKEKLFENVQGSGPSPAASKTRVAISSHLQGEQRNHERENAKQEGGKPASLTPFWRHFCCGVAQVLSLVFVLSFFALQWLAPYLTYTILIEEEYDFATSVVGAFASLVLLYPLMLAIVIGLKWLIIGRYKSGTYPLWGLYYFRFWLVTSIEATIPVSYLSGTPLLSIYLRLMGAKVGRSAFVQSDNFAIYDLLSIGEESSINSDASMLGYSVSGGLLRIGPVRIGNRCVVGTRTTLGENTAMGDGSVLEDLSLLPSGQTVPTGEIWLGSPARPVSVSERNGIASLPGGVIEKPGLSSVRRFGFGTVHAAGLFVFPVLVVSALFPGIAVMNHLNYIDPYYWYLFLSPLVAVSFVGLLCLEIVALKWVLLGRVEAGCHSVQSWYYVRKWFVDKTMELSLDVVGPLYASVYLGPWYKLLGAKLGRGAEISTASFISPDLLSVGAESFIADNVSLGAPRVEGGCIRIGPNRIGTRAFIGNSALLPPGAMIGDEVLIGCLSASPPRVEDAMQRDSSWLGSPAMSLRQRKKDSSFEDGLTFYPSAKLRVIRATIEFVRVVTPSTGFIILTSLLFSALLLLHDHYSLFETLLFFPALYLGCGLAATGFTVLIKWLLVGRYQPGDHPLWSTFVWRNELINAVHEHLASPFLVGALTGTPFIGWYLSGDGRERESRGDEDRAEERCFHRTLLVAGRL